MTAPVLLPAERIAELRELQEALRGGRLSPQWRDHALKGEPCIRCDVAASIETLIAAHEALRGARGAWLVDELPTQIFASCPDVPIEYLDRCYRVRVVNEAQP